MTKTELATREDKDNEIVQRLVQRLPRCVDPDRFASFALATMRDTALRDCTDASKWNALKECANLGLFPDRNLGHVWLVPFRNKGQYEVTLIPGYQGYIELARRSGQVKDVHTGIVHENDTYREWTDEKGRHLLHEPDVFGDRGKPVGVYCVATLRDGGSQIESMTWDEVQAVKKRSRASSGPWVTDEMAMVRKTVVRRARKYWPQSTELARLGQIDDERDGLIIDARPIEGRSRVAASAIGLPTAEHTEPEPQDDEPPTGEDFPE